MIFLRRSFPFLVKNTETNNEVIIFHKTKGEAIALGVTYFKGIHDYKIKRKDMVKYLVADDLKVEYEVPERVVLTKKEAVRKHILYFVDEEECDRCKSISKLTEFRGYALCKSCKEKVETKDICSFCNGRRNDEGLIIHHTDCVARSKREIKVFLELINNDNFNFRTYAAKPKKINALQYIGKETIILNDGLVKLNQGDYIIQEELSDAFILSKERFDKEFEPINPL